LALALCFAAVLGCQRQPTPTEGDAGAPAAKREEREFAMRCGACHERERAVHGPSLQEIATLHAADPEGIVRWARAPGRKRAQFQPMPSFRHLSEEDLRGIARFMITTGRP
jgi:cytochrome c